MSSSSRKMLQAAAGNAGGADFYPYTIENSIFLNHSNNEYLRRYLGTSASSNTDQRKGVISFWFKHTEFGGGRIALYNHMDDGYHSTTIDLYNNENANELVPGSIFFQDYQSSPGYQLDAVIGTSNRARLFRDRSAWYHFCYIWDTTQGSATDRVKTYINGVLQGWTHDTTVSTPRFSGSPQLPGLNYQMNTLAVGINSTANACRQYIGAYGAPFIITDQYVYSNVQMAEFQAIDGIAYDISYFGEYKNGVWVPKQPSGISYGNEGSYLKFDNAGSLGADSSGNGNHWTVINGAKQLIDTPTNNFATLNPLASSARTTLSDGNLVSFGNSSLEDSVDYSTIAVTSGKWYWEEKINAISSAASYPCVGVARIIQQPSNGKYTGDSTGGGVGYFRTGAVDKEGSSVATYATFTTNDVIGVALDVDNLQISFYKNGTLQGTVTGLTSSIYYMSNTNYYNSQTTTNFGQTSFTYTPPTDHLALCTANLPEPTLGPNSNENVTDYYNTVLYTGNGTAIGSGGKSVTGVGFQPNMVWTKNRDAAQSWAWMDTQIGAGKYWTHNYTSTGVITNSESLSSMDADGFTVGNLANVNVNAQNYVAYAFKKRAEYFDIVGYSGTGSVQNISHNLGVVPNVIIVKRVTNANTAPSYFNSGQVTDPQTDYIGLFDTGVFIDNDTLWNDTAPTSTHFTVGTSSGTNLNVDTYIAYLFANMDGMFKTGSYTGNGSADGPFVYTGFRPAFILIKALSGAENWVIYDTARDTYNELDSVLYTNSSNSEFSGTTVNTDALSNGFKPRDTWSAINGSGTKYIFMAFSEMPFRYSNAR